MLWELWQTYYLEIFIGTIYLGPWVCLFVGGFRQGRYALEFEHLAGFCITVPMALLPGYQAIYTPYELAELEKGWVQTTASVVHQRISFKQDKYGGLVYRYELPLANGERAVYFGTGPGTRYRNLKETTIIYAKSDPSVSRKGVRFKPEWWDQWNSGRSLIAWFLALFGAGATVLGIFGYIEKKQKQLRYQRKMRVVEARHARHAERGVRAVRKMIELEAQREEEARRKQSQRKQQ